jgi:hypothetical protein
MESDYGMVGVSNLMHLVVIAVPIGKEFLTIMKALSSLYSLTRHSKV